MPTRPHSSMHSRWWSTHNHPCLHQGDLLLFFTSTIMDLIVVETNRYATTCIGDSWEPITPEELCAYFGFMMLMGLVKLPSIYCYWQKDLVYHYSPIADRISRKRFFDIHRFIHFANNATLSAPGSSDYDKLGKIRPILTSLTDRFSAIYEPGKDLSINEAMIPYKGRSSLKQYMRMWNMSV